MRREPGQGAARRWFVKWVGIRQRDNRSNKKETLSLEMLSYVLAVYHNRCVAGLVEKKP